MCNGWAKKWGLVSQRLGYVEYPERVNSHELQRLQRSKEYAWKTPIRRVLQAFREHFDQVLVSKANLLAWREMDGGGEDQAVAIKKRNKRQAGLEENFNLCL